MSNEGNGHNGGNQYRKFMFLQSILTVLLIIAAVLFIAYLLQSLLS